MESSERGGGPLLPGEGSNQPPPPPVTFQSQTIEQFCKLFFRHSQILYIIDNVIPSLTKIRKGTGS